MEDQAAQTMVLEAAERLFYGHGIRSVGMDQIRDASKIPLNRLYRLFPSKEHLVEEVLRRRDVIFMDAVTEFVADRPSPRDKVLGLFDYLYEWFREPNYRGCPFINAYGEMHATSARVTAVVEAEKLALLSFLSELVAAAKAPRAVAEQLLILANGAMVMAAILRSPEPARAAKTAAAALMPAARSKATAR
jgi:AcrR family transcriptional regulator